MVNQQHRVKQETVVVNDHNIMYPCPLLYHFKNVSMTPLGKTRYIGMEIHMITFTTVQLH